jgi:tRNA(Ile)-lysidine synthase
MPRPSATDLSPGFDPAILPVRRRTLVVAVSGGRDSLLLLHLLLRAGWTKMVVAHLNHGLRGRASGQDARFVRAVATRLGLPVEISKADVAGLASRRKQSVETIARECRQLFFREVAGRHRASHVVLAHHADDQAETILANLCRGAGLNGLAGMRAVQPLDDLVLLRPMLKMPRAEIDRLIATHALAYREDASNASAVHRRNRLRHEVLPLLDAVFARRVAPLLVRAGEQARLAADDLESRARAALANPACLGTDRRLRLGAAWQALSPSVQPLVLRLWLREIWRVPEIGQREVEQALALLQPGGPARINLPGGWQLRRKARQLGPVRVAG